MFWDKKGLTTPTGVFKVSTLACCIALSANAYSQDTTETPNIELPDSNFLDSVRSALEDQTKTIEEPDVTRDYLERTLEKPSLNTEIPAQEIRDEGPRISVRKFIFHRLEEYPEYGITKDTIEKLAEDLRSKYMKEDQMFASGFTRDNLEELAAFLDKIGAQKDPRDMGMAELRGLVGVIEQQNAARGISYGDLEEITSELTAYYRKQGLFLAQVQVPAQDVEDGVVALTVQEGLLGQINVEGNKHYADKRLQKPFIDQQGNLVSHQKVEEGMYLLNDLPGLNVTGYFSAGEKPGETALNLKVREEKRWRLAIRGDNHGSQFTGNNRLRASLDLLNPLGIGDQLTIGALQSVNPENSTLGQFNYSLPFFGTRTRVAFSADHNEFKLTAKDDPTINQIGLEGVNDTYSIKLDHKFKRSRDFNFSGNFGISDKKSNIVATKTNSDGFGSSEHVQSTSLGFYVDSLGKKVRMLNLANVSIQYGQHQGIVEESRGKDYSKIEISTHSLFFLPLPFTEAQSRIVFKGQFQYSDNELPAFEQSSLGGAGAVRAFTTQKLSADQSAIVSAEWYFDLPSTVNDYMQFALTTDAAYGVINNHIDTKTDKLIPAQWAHMSGAGMLFKFNWNDSFSSQFSIATPLKAESSKEDFGKNQDDVQLFADFTILFE